MVLISYSNNTRKDSPELDISQIFKGNDTPDGWKVTFNNTKKHDLIIIKESKESQWKSLCKIRGYVYSLTKNIVSTVNVSGVKCPIHSMNTTKIMGNKEIVDITFAIDYTCVQDDNDSRWKLNIQFPSGFTPMCLISKDTDFQHLTMELSNIGVVACNVTPVSFTLIWDIPGTCTIKMNDKKDVNGQKYKMDVINVTPCSTYDIMVKSETMDQICTVSVTLPERTVKFMNTFLKSKQLPDKTYDLSSVSQDNIRYLRHNQILKSGDRVLMKPVDKDESVYMEIAQCGDSLELVSGKNIYIVPDMYENGSQYLCLQDQVNNFTLEFDRSESFVKYRGGVFPHGSNFKLEQMNIEVVKGSIILLVSNADDIDTIAFPGGSTDATTVQSAGDVIIRDLVMRDLYQVGEKVTGDVTYVANGFYVYDETLDTTTECTRISGGLSDDKTTGSMSIDVLNSSALKRTFHTTPTETTISSDDITSTFSGLGLSFDSDEGSIYFGADKNFRIHFIDATGLDPALLAIQALSGTDYVTRFLVTSEL